MDVADFFKVLFFLIAGCSVAAFVRRRGPTSTHGCVCVCVCEWWRCVVCVSGACTVSAAKASRIRRLQRHHRLHLASQRSVRPRLLGRNRTKRSALSALKRGVIQVWSLRLCTSFLPAFFFLRVPATPPMERCWYRHAFLQYCPCGAAFYCMLTSFFIVSPSFVLNVLDISKLFCCALCISPFPPPRVGHFRRFVACLCFLEFSPSLLFVQVSPIYFGTTLRLTLSLESAEVSHTALISLYIYFFSFWSHICKKKGFLCLAFFKRTAVCVWNYYYFLVLVFESFEQRRLWLCCSFV